MLSYYNIELSPTQNVTSLLDNLVQNWIPNNFFSLQNQPWQNQEQCEDKCIKNLCFVFFGFNRTLPPGAQDVANYYRI